MAASSTLLGDTLQAVLRSLVNIEGQMATLQETLDAQTAKVDQLMTATGALTAAVNTEIQQLTDALAQIGGGDNTAAVAQAQASTDKIQQAMDALTAATTAMAADDSPPP